MTSFDAYEDDMGRFRDLSEADINRIMAGRVPVDGDEFSELAGGLAALKAVKSRGTDQIAPRHLAEIAEASGVVVRTPSPEAEAHRGITTGWRRAVRLTTSLVAKIGVASAALALSTAGLAVAGVDLPGTTAEDTFQKVGIELPNQGGDAPGKSVVERVHAAQDAATEKGCEFGQAVSTAASMNDNRKSTTEKDPCTRSEGTAEDDTPDDGENGRSGETKGKAGQDHGKAGQDHGKAGQDHGKAGQDHGKAGQDHGKAGQDHGKAGQDHGKPGDDEVEDTL